MTRIEAEFSDAERAAHDTAALADVRAVVAAAEAHDDRPPVSDQAMVAATQGRRLVARFTATLEGEELPRPAAVGIVGDGEIDLVVHPDARGRGIGSAALARLLERATMPVKAWSHGVNPAADALLQRAGFSPVRELLRMTLDPALLPHGDPVEAPDWLSITPHTSGSAVEAAAWVAVNAAAFAEHPEQGAMTLDDFAALTREEWFDAADLLLAFDTRGDGAERPAAFAWVKTVVTPASQTALGGTECELYALGVHPDEAGAGLGRILLDRALRRMAEHDPDRISLYVDGDNERAVRLYERTGFTVDQRSRQWVKENGRHE